MKPINVPSRYKSFGYILTGIVAVIGVILRVQQYVADTSLWIDELAIAHNLTERSLMRLMTAPLDRNQVAPRGFLLIEKLVAMLTSSDLALRLFPFLCSVAAVVLFCWLTFRVLSAEGAFVAMTLFALAEPLIYYGVQLKQYSCDVLASVILLHLALSLWRSCEGRERWMAAITGAVIVWFSQAAVLILVGIGFVLFIRSWRAGSVRRMLPVVGTWAVACVAATLAGYWSMTASTRAYMHAFWSNGFMPLSVSKVAATLWPLPSLVALFDRTLGYVFPTLFITVVIVGFIALWRVNAPAAAITLAPLLVTIAAAAAQQYPFSQRLIFFLLPNLFLAAGALVTWIAHDRRRILVVTSWVAALVLIIPAVMAIATQPPPYRVEETKGLLVQLRPRLRTGDRVYVYYGGGSAFTYYADKFGVATDRYVLGDCHRADTRSYYREIDTFRGSPRVWTILVHAIPKYRERYDILSYLGTIGQRRDAVVVRSTLSPFPFGAAEAYLYDLSIPARLHATDAATFRITGSQHLDPAAGCSGSQQPRMIAQPARLGR